MKLNDCNTIQARGRALSGDFQIGYSYFLVL